MRVKEVLKPSVSSGVLWVLSFANERKYPAGGKKHYVKKKPAGGIKIKSYWKNRPSETAKKNCKGYYGLPRVLRTLAMTLLNVSK